MGTRNDLSRRLARMRVAVTDAAMAVGDRVRGLDTQSMGPAPEGDDQASRYVASGWRFLPRILLPGEIRPDDVLLDVGCGKGRVLIVAAERYRFHRVLGVECSADLAAVARSNLARRGLTEVEVVVADARTWPVPDDVTVAYLCHPFKEAATRQFIDRLGESMARRPRRVRLILAGVPSYPHVLLERGFRVIRERPWHHLALFEAAG